MAKRKPTFRSVVQNGVTVNTAVSRVHPLLQNSLNVPKVVVVEVDCHPSHTCNRASIVLEQQGQFLHIEGI